MQPSLFDPARRGHRAAVACAKRAGAEWSDAALAFLQRFAAKRMGWFLAEDVVAAFRAAGHPEPPDRRAWGGVFLVARRRGWIAADGYAPATSSNGSPKVRWVALSQHQLPAHGSLCQTRK